MLGLNVWKLLTNSKGEEVGTK